MRLQIHMDMPQLTTSGWSVESRMAIYHKITWQEFEHDKGFLKINSFFPRCYKLQINHNLNFDHNFQVKRSGLSAQWLRLFFLSRINGLLFSKSTQGSGFSLIIPQEKSQALPLITDLDYCTYYKSKLYVAGF